MVTKRDLEVAIAAYGLGRILPAGSTRAAVRALIPQVVRAGKVIAPTAGRTAATLAAANPVSTGLGLGLAATQTPSGQALLEAAAERGRMDRVRAQQMLDEFIFTQVTQPAQQVTGSVGTGKPPVVAEPDLIAGATEGEVMSAFLFTELGAS